MKAFISLMSFDWNVIIYNEIVQLWFWIKGRENHCNMLDCKGNYGNTALHIAVHCGRVEMTRYLLKKGFDVNKQNELSETPLHLAAGYGSHYATGKKSNKASF